MLTDNDIVLFMRVGKEKISKVEKSMEVLESKETVECKRSLELLVG